MTKIRVALRKQLELLPAVSTAWEGIFFAPVIGVAYQEARLLSGFIDDTYDIEVGNHVFQVGLYYPADSGTKDVEDRASEIMGHFKRGTKLENGDTCVIVSSPPEVANLGTIDDRIIRVVTINIKTQG